LAKYNPESLAEWKKVLWEGTGPLENFIDEQWQEITGRLAIF